MRILLTYARRPPYPLFGLHLTKAFQRLGHSAILLGVRDRPWWGKLAKRLPHRWRYGQWDPVGWANTLLLRAVQRYRPDAILEIGGDLFEPSTLRLVKQRYAVRLAIWLAEGPFSNGPPPVVAEYDVIASTSSVAVQQLRQAGFHHASYLPFATEPRWFRASRWQEPPPPYRVGFVGAYDSKRAQFLEQVSDLGLCIWGTEWDQASSAPLRPAIRKSRGVFGRTLVQCYQMTRIHVSIQRERMTFLLPSGQRVGTGLNFRLFDAPACGSLIVTEWIQELPEAFSISQEIEVFTTPAELRDKVCYFLSHEPARQAMIQRARARVLQEHTCEARARQWLKWFDA